MYIKFGLACLLVAATVAMVQGADCDYTVSLLNFGWGGKRAPAMDCMEAIPARAGENANTTAAVHQVFKGYSFSDLVTANIGPYNVAVDWETELTRIESALYIGDYGIHNDLGKLFNRMGDAHLVYIKPRGYLYMRYYYPFSVISRNVNGAQKFYAGAGPVNENTWDALCACSSLLPTYWGSEITKIDDVDIKDWLVAKARKGGIYVDDGVLVNNLLGSLTFGGFSLGAHEAPELATVKYTFNGTTDTTFDYVFMYQQKPANVAEVEGYNHDLSGRNAKRAVGEHQGDGYGYHSIASSERLAIEQLEKAMLTKRSARDATTAQLSKVAQSHLIGLKATQKASAAYGAKLAEASKKRDFNMEGFLAQNYVPMIHTRLNAIEAALVAAMDLEAGFDRKAAVAKTDLLVNAVASTTTDVRASNKKNAAAAVEAPLLTGDRSMLSVSRDTTNSGIGVYNGTIILKLKGFDLDSQNDFWNAVKDVHTMRNTYPNQQLIIDVAGNGGGLVCLNYITLSYLVEPWRNHSTSGSDVLYSPYDWRLSTLNDAMWTHARSDVFGGEVSPSTGVSLGSAVHDSPRTVTYNSRTSQYSQFFNWDLCPDNFFESPSLFDVRSFDKIILLTDGTCGSSCAYFLTHLRNQNKVRVVSYGGITGEPLATSSFAGGNVYQYDSIVQGATELGYAAAANLSYMDHNAATTFNFRANYNLGDTIPRQFQRVEADWHIATWEPLSTTVFPGVFGDTPTTEQEQSMANLYASVASLFNDMPTGLARVDHLPPAPVAAPTEKTGDASHSAPAIVAISFFALLLALVF